MTMSGSKVDVAWSPQCDDYFLTCKSELNLYKIEDLPQEEGSKPQGMTISENSQAILVSSNAEHQYIKCIDWYPKAEPANLVAVGLANGKVVLTSFGKPCAPDPHRLYKKEFSPKHQRQCAYVHWNPVETHLLAEGLERYRNDASVLIWDVTQQARQAYSDWTMVDRKISYAGTHDPGTVIQRPFVEIGPGEVTSSLAWFPHEPQSLVTGMNNKFLKIFDLRDTSRQRNAAYTKCVYGVQVDSFTQYRLASFHETQISIWDIRAFEKPLATLAENKNVIKIAWSPTRSGLLACLTKESSIVNLYDMQHSLLADEMEPTGAERKVSYPDGEIISSFDWHPRNKNRMLMANQSGAVRDIQLFERISVNWSPDMNMTWAYGTDLYQIDTMTVSEDLHTDISSLMYSRAMASYGVNEDLKVNSSLVGTNQSLRNLWDWLQLMRDMTVPAIPDSTTPAAIPAQVMGIKSLVCDLPAPSTGDGTASHTFVELLSWQTVNGHKLTGRRKVYHSPERTKAVELCGWCYCKDKPSAPIIDRLEADGQFERAASIAIFNMKIGRAIDILYEGSKHCQGGDINLTMVAMALAGFSEEKNTLWQDISSRLGSELKHPYLKVMFSLLTMDGDNWDEIINNPSIDVCDRVAIACFYLPDHKLSEFVEKLKMTLIQNGDLSGIILTGFSEECLDLLQMYIDQTGDIQTVAVSLIQPVPYADLFKDKRSREWIDMYRELLDTWSLWHKRAEFDIYQQKCSLQGVSLARPQMFVSCNFCTESVSFSTLARRSRTFMFGGTAAQKPRGMAERQQSKKNVIPDKSPPSVSSCPNCRKPLPRCALCLINMGTSAGSGTKTPGSKEIEPDMKRMAVFSDWFTWCQSCRHGGHAQHMAEWYQDHEECPVTGCDCRCASLDIIENSMADLTISTMSGSS